MSKADANPNDEKLASDLAPEIATLWREILGLPRIGLNDNFFESGGTSLLATLLISRINKLMTERGLSELSIATFFEHPTLRALTAAIKGEAPEAPFAADSRATSDIAKTTSSAIAIIGMTGRFPGAESVEELWKNLSEGVESVTFFDHRELEPHEQLLAAKSERYVAARPLLKHADKFDAGFFGIYPKEAATMDPQHRVFLECAWEVLERAGYDPAHTKDPVGIFAGCSMNTYFMRNIVTGREFLEDFTGSYQVDNYVAMLGNDKDFLPTRVSYKLNLRGPSMSVQSACSTSLVAVAQAAQSLLTHGCDMALAGAVSITFPEHRGYVPQEGGLASLDGHCRPFDHKASGTVFGHGSAVLLLKRLDDALADGDQVLAVIKGFALNNDGSVKVGYTAPSVEGQAQVIARAQKMAGVPAESITYLEAHGTGTPLGDPIEVAALKKAFRAATSETAFCSLGTAKANVGHLDVAAGATGLIKTVLQLQHRQIPGLLHYEQPNPHLGIEGSPFKIDRTLRAWETNGTPLRAGVSAFGVGGTNAHLVVEEAPARRASDSGRNQQLLVWSARTPQALESLTSSLAQHFHASSDNMNDAAYTLQTGRSPLALRRAAVVSSNEEATVLLSDNAARELARSDKPLDNPGIVFCFPGQGVQTIGMGRRLYETEKVFREALDRCARILTPLLGVNLLDVLYPAHLSGDVQTDEMQINDAQTKLNQTLYAQPSIFSFEYALAQLWLTWGIRPEAMVGHSVGEYVAATIAGVFSLEDALKMISARCHLMQELPAGSMLAVRRDEATVAKLLPVTLDIAAINSPQLCVVSGPTGEIDAFIAKLDAEKIVSRRLATSHAFHSRMVDPAVAPFAETVATVSFSEPKIPYVSTLTGKWATLAEISQPAYWTRQLRHAVRFADAITEILKTPERILLEVGPTETLVQLMRQIGGTAVLSSLGGLKNRDKEEKVPEDRSILHALGTLWTLGATINWQGFHSGYTRNRVLLPTYPFERQRHWIEAPPYQSSAQVLPGPVPEAPAAPVATIPAEVLIMATPDTVSMLSELKDMIADLSGTDLTGADADASFLELGFDSLFLTQLTQAIQSKYKLKLTFRQIMESYPTLEGLAKHLDDAVAPELKPAAAAPTATPAPVAAAPVAYAAPAAPQAVAPLTPIAAPAISAPAGSLESLLASQVQALSGLFQQQMEFLRGQSFSSPVAAAAVQAAPPIAPLVAPATTPASSIPSPAAAAPAKEEAPKKPVFTPFKPLSRGETGGLNPTQEKYLKDFISSYTARTPGSKEFTQANRAVFADGRVVSGFNAQYKEMVYPLVVERAKGAYLWDKDGNRYIDILNGYGAILYGHSPDFIVEAVHEQLDIGFPIGPQTPLVSECSRLVSELTGMERVTFCNTGSEAVMGAMRLARTVTGRNLIVLFSGDYHGSFDEVLVKSVGNQRSMPVAPGIPRESVANTLVLDYGTDEALEIIRKRADEIAAVLVEPVQSRHPELRPAEFLKEVRKITEQSGSALIFDEVVTGFRTHPGGMQAVYGIRADLATYGKVVAGGLPVGILAGSPAFMDALDGGMWQYGDNSFPQVGVTFYAGTFMRHPLAMAAVKASLEHIKESGPSLQTELAEKTSSLVSDLNALFREFNYQSSIETFASWFFFSPAAEPQLARLLHYHLREQGIHIQEGFPCFLTTAHTNEDLDFVRKAFRTSLEKMQAGQAIGKADAAVAVTAPVAAKASAPAVETAPVAHDISITEPQREILIGTQLGDEANCAFNESTSLRLKGKLDEDALIRSLEKLVLRHESLRSEVCEDGDTIHISDTAILPIEHDDLTALDAATREQRLKEIIAREASTSFDLYNGPLFRMRLVRLANDEHVLVSTAHHIIFDGWSTNVLFSELSALYNAAVTGSDADLAAPLTFTAYAAQQAEHEKTEENSEVEQYWLNEFKTLPSPLDLPTDRPRPAMRSNEGATRRFIFGAEFLKSVRKAGAKQGSTLFATLLAGYAQLIHRLSQQQDVVIGIPTAGQSLLENGGTLVGHCVNFLPIRSTFDPAQSTGQFVKQSRKKLLDAQDHQNYTYGTLLRKLKIQRESSRLPLVEVQFNVEQVGSGLKYEGLAADLSANAKTHVNMDLFFNFVDRGDELWLDVDYNTGLFDESTIERWCGHLQAILEAFVADAEQPIGQVAILTPAQQQQILVDWNKTATDFPRTSSIQQVFEEQAARTPNAVAILFNGQSLTYSELNEKSNQLARFLRTSGIQPGDRVALCLDRSLEVPVSLLAVLKAGASYVPIDASYPAQRIQFLVENSESKLLLTQSALLDKLPELKANIINLDTDWASIALESGANFPAAAVTGESEAYVMYTSGSTGNPKGVRVPHRAVLRLVKNNNFASFAPTEIFLQLAPLSFDASTFEIWGALLNGGRLVLAPAGRVTPEDIGTLIAKHNVTTLWLTAALFHLVATTHLETLRPLRQLLAGGDVLSVTHVRRILEALPHLRLINGYGPTENTTFTCCHTITPASLTIGSVPIGRPIANTRIYLVDASMQPVPVGVAGELLAAGDGVSLGYLNAPELTSEKFIEHTFDGHTERLYRTGDLARYRADGTVEFLGRADTQVKVRGYRIELSEIEYALERSPLVKSAVVSVRTDWVTANDSPGDKRLAAYIIPQKTGDDIALVAELRTWLKGQLPEYMQPAAIVVVESFPRTVNGKVDRRALPAPQPERMLHERAIVYPRTPQEDVLASIWSKVLNLKEISVEDSIFELGGDSLMIFRINTLANQAGMKITARHIFEFKTIAAICAQVPESRDEIAENPAGTIRPVARSLHRKPRTILQ